MLLYLLHSQISTEQLCSWKKQADEDHLRIRHLWVTQQELEEKGLSSSVQKVYKLYKKASAPAKKGGITRFFKPANK